MASSRATHGPVDVITSYSIHYTKLYDRLNTDIAGGNAAGLNTILVLSGISSREDLAKANGNQPDFVFEDISELTARLK